MKVIYVKDEGGDWAGLYIDGELDDQNHSLDVGMVLEALYDRGLIEYESYIVPEEAWDELGHLPDEFEDIPEGVLE
jgi:hypothetical protein